IVGHEELTEVDGVIVAAEIWQRFGGRGANGGERVYYQASLRVIGEPQSLKLGVVESAVALREKAFDASNDASAFGAAERRVGRIELGVDGLHRCHHTRDEGRSRTRASDVSLRLFGLRVVDARRVEVVATDRSPDVDTVAVEVGVRQVLVNRANHDAFRKHGRNDAPAL